MHKILSRQIHLDFHTAGDIPNVGGNFDKKQFQEALTVANVNHINLFAKCHHGYCYYPTKVGKQHPHAVNNNLLGQQIEACKEIDVIPIPYITVGWSVLDSLEHPEWTMRNKEEKRVFSAGDANAHENDFIPYYSWEFMCPNTKYAQLIYEHTQEILHLFDVEGLWYDITGYGLCFCNSCRSDMREQNVNIENEREVRQYSVKMWKHFYRSCKDILHKKDKDATIFFNGTTLLHQFPGQKEFSTTFYDGIHEENTRIELEDLPSTWGGYDKLPIRAKLFSKTNKPMIAMSGKFHTAWGEFGGIKSSQALQYEIALMLASGTHPNIGDQLHPEGLMDVEAYKRIGVAFDYVKKYEDLIDNALPYSNLALYYSGSQKEDEGVAYMLLQNHIDFEIAAKGYSIDKYSTIILPGVKCLDYDEAKRINDWVQAGGKLLILGESLLNEENEVLFDAGVKYIGKADCNVDYVKIEQALDFNELFKNQFLCYNSAIKVQNIDAQVLSNIYEPYFNRTYKHYCSHREYPYKPQPAKHSGATKKGNIVYCAHNLGKDYFEFGAKVQKDYFINLLALVYNTPVMQVSGLGSAGRVSLLQQDKKQRYIMHVLYAPVHQRGEVQVVEELPVISDINVTLNLSQKIKSIETRDGEDVDFDEINNVVKINKLQGHKVVILHY